MNSHIITDLLYSNSNIQQHIYYPSSRNWELVDSFGPVPALSWGRATGVIWEIWYLPGHRPIRRGLEQFRACQDSSCLSSTTGSRLVFRERKKIDILLRQVKKTKFCCQKKKFTMSPGPHSLISNGDPSSETWKLEVPCKASN